MFVEEWIVRLGEYRVFLSVGHAVGHVCEREVGKSKLKSK